MVPNHFPVIARLTGDPLTNGLAVGHNLRP
jgi:hypothetical protein